MRRRAFTLIELAISLTVIGLVIGGSFQAIKAMRERAKVTEAKEQLLAVKNSVLGYAMEWPNLPSNAEFDQNLSYATGSQNPIFYTVDTALSTYDNDVCEYTTTSLKVVDNAATPIRTIDNVAFVVVHEGTNYNMQTTLNGLNEIHIYGASTQIDANASPVNITESYDDIVAWVTLSELQKVVDCSKNRFVIINDYALPRDTNSSTAYIGAKIYADGGYSLADGGDSGTLEDYEWCIEDVDSANLSNWLVGDCNGNLNIELNCSVATYSQCTFLNLNGKSSQNPIVGTHRLDIYARDKKETIRKSLSITIDP